MILQSSPATVYIWIQMVSSEYFDTMIATYNQGICKKNQDLKIRQDFWCMKFVYYIGLGFFRKKDVSSTSSVVAAAVVVVVAVVVVAVAMLCRDVKSKKVALLVLILFRSPSQIHTLI